MEISSVQHQARRSEVMEEMIAARPHQHQDEKKGGGRAQGEQSLKCPRCESSNTKFCYYNNYSLSQPRYFCKACRRYWTQGGSLRNVPVGGGCRKNRRSSSSPSSSSSSSNNSTSPPSSTSSTKIQDPPLINPLLFPPLPPLSYDPSDLTLAPLFFGSAAPKYSNPNPSAGFLDFLRSGFANPSLDGLSGLCGYAVPFDASAGLQQSPFDGFSSAATEVDNNAAAAVTGNNNTSSSNNNNGGGYNWHGIVNSSLI